MRGARSLVLYLLLALSAGCRERAGVAAGGGGAEPASEARQQDKFRQPARLVAALGLRPGDAVADVGAGGGYLTLRLARAVGERGRVVATDIDAAALAALGQRARGAGLGTIETRVVPPDRPSLEPASYDLILLAQVDHLLPDRAAYLRALLSALRPGGRIAIANKERQRQPLLASLQGLPVSVEDPAIGLPGQFLLLLRPLPAPASSVALHARPGQPTIRQLAREARDGGEARPPPARLRAGSCGPVEGGTGRSPQSVEPARQ